MPKLRQVIIGFAGKPQVGKTTAANYVVKKYGAGSFFVGDGVKEEVDKMLRAVGLRYKEKEKPHFRPLLTWLAVERREHDPDYWVKILLKKIKLPAVVSDVRYPNEVKLIERSGGMVIKVERERDSRQDTFETEVQLDKYKFKAVIPNNGSFKDLYKKIDRTLVEYGLIDDRAK